MSNSNYSVISSPEKEKEKEKQKNNCRHLTTFNIVAGKFYDTCSSTLTPTFDSSIYVTRRCRDIVMMVAMVVNLGMVLWGFYLLKLGNERCTFLVISHVYLKSSQQAA